MTITTEALPARTPSLMSYVMQVPLALIALAACAALGCFDLATDPARLAHALGDTDDATRLVQVRDFFAGAPWFDMTAHRIGAPDALVSHWSRLIDVGIAALIGLFGLMLAAAQAELAARFVWPLLLLFGLLLVIAGEAERLAGRLAAFVAIGLVLASITGTAEFTPGRIDHHGAMILGLVCGVVLFARGLDQPRAASAAGIALGLGTAIGYEALALTVASLAFAGLWSLVTRRCAEGVARAVLAFAATLAVAWLATTAPSKWLHSSCDALSINLVGLAALGAIGVAVTLRRGRAWPLDVRLGVPAAFGAIGVVLYIVAEPACLAGPFGQQDRAIGPIWLEHVTETKSLLWLASAAPAVALVFAVTSILGLLAGWRLAAQRQQPGSVRSDDGAKLALVMLGLAVVLGCWQIKLLPYASLLGVVPLACVIARLDGIQGVSAPTLRTFAAVLSSQFGLALLAGPVAAKMTPADHALGQWLETARRCIATPVVAPLAELPPGLVFADMNLGPFIAALTSSRVVVAPYHRLDKAIIDTDQMMFGPTEAARQRLRALGVDYVAICPGLTRAHGHAVLPDSLYAMLNANAAPGWLVPASLNGATPIKVWRVMR